MPRYFKRPQLSYEEMRDEYERKKYLDSLTLDDYYPDPSQEMPWEEWQRTHYDDLKDEFRYPQIWVRSKKNWRMAKVNPKYVNPRVPYLKSKYKAIGDLFHKLYPKEFQIKPYYYPDYVKRVIKVNRKKAIVRKNHILALKRLCRVRFGWASNDPRTLFFVKQRLPKITK